MSFDVDITWARAGFDLNAAFQTGAGITALFGPSGSGKTSILRCVAGLASPDTARIAINGQKRTKSIGFVFQEPRLFPHLTVDQNLRLATRFGQKIVQSQFDHWVSILEIACLLDRYPEQISGGEAQRVAIARAVLAGPKALCMDEPLASLDATRRKAILPYLERLKSHLDIPILYVTHDISEAAVLADHLVLLDQGRVQAAGPIWDILSDPKLAPQVGVKASGTVVSCRVQTADPGLQLTTFAFDGGTLILPSTTRDVGAHVRLRIAAQDIILATEKPKGISALNVLEGQIVDVFSGKGPGAMVQFCVGKTLFLARVTKASLARMGLEPGAKIFAIIKASAFDPLAQI